MEIKAIGNRLIVRVLRKKHVIEHNSSIALPESALSEQVAEGVVVSVGDKCNSGIKEGDLVAFEGNAMRRFQTPRVDVSVWGIIFEDDVYAVFSGIDIPKLPELEEVNG